jgi:pimeloyl-ACP methyl ester carboxylesterase
MMDHVGPDRHDVPAGGRSGFVIVDDRQVHYLEWGDRRAAPVVCLHGGGQTAYMWEELGAALASRYYLLAPDLPAHGDSDPIFDAPFDRHVLADAIAPLLDEFGIPRAAFVGASLGGITSLTLAAAHPGLVGAVVLVDIGHRLEDAGVDRIIEFMGKHESFATLEEAAAAVAEYLPQRRGPTDPQRLRRNLRRRDDGRWEWKHGLGRQMRERGVTFGGWRELVQGMDREAATIQVPALVLRGSQSDVLSDEGAGEIAALLPDARLAAIGAAGHHAAGDNPETTVSLVRAFLDEIAW